MLSFGLELFLFTHTFSNIRFEFIILKKIVDKMSFINFKINKELLNLQFEGYKLSLDPIPVLKQPVVDGMSTLFYFIFVRDGCIINLLMAAFVNT